MVISKLEKTHQFPSRLQSRILAAMYYSEEEFVTTETILKQTGIAQSTWSEEQNRLIESGLLEKKQSKVMNARVITRIMNYKLTDKGRIVAHNLTNISRIMAPDQFLREFTPSPAESGSTGTYYLDQSIQECFEIGLESFGMNLDKLVREELETSGLRWTDVSRNPDRLVVQLNDLFGRNGALTIERMIAANLKSRFGIRSITSDNITSIVGELRASSPYQNKPDLKNKR